MQVFEALELKEFPYMEIKEIFEGKTINDIINGANEEKAFLIVDHDKKGIWTYNGVKSSFKLQIYGGILAGILQKQLKLLYKVSSLNFYSKESKKFKELMEKPVGGGRVQPIKKEDFPRQISDEKIGRDLSIFSHLNVNKVIEEINEVSKPDNYLRKIMIIGNNIYSDEQEPVSFLQKEKEIIKSIKLGHLNRGFTFFGDFNYSTRLIVKDRKVQGMELYVNKEEKYPTLELKIPTIYDVKFSNIGDINELINSFHIPEKLHEEENNPK